MISSQGHDQNAKDNQSNPDWTSGETCHVNGCRPLDGPRDKEFAHLKVRVHLYDDKEEHPPDGVAAAELSIDADPRQADHEVDQGSDDSRAAGRRLVRTVAFGVITGVMVGAAFAWHFYGNVHRTQIVDAGKLVSTQSPRSNVIPVESASKTSDRVPAQDQAAMPVLPPGQVSATPGPPELQQQIEAMMSDVAVVRRVVERLAAVQEQMALDIATLQKSGQQASLLPHSPAVPAPSRKYAPNTAHSDVVAHSLSVPVRIAPTPTP